MKYIDKFLKWLGTDRNTFICYILTLLTVYIFVDRIVEMLMMFFTGISLSYWGPITYTFAFACPVFAFLFSGTSQLIKSNKMKILTLYMYCTILYVIGISMAVQWINGGLWVLFLSVPNYADIVKEFPELIRPAFQAIAIYLPLTTFYPLFKWLYTVLQENKDIRDGIVDYQGIDLSNKKVGLGPYTCEIVLCKDKINGNLAKIPESRRFDGTLIIGASGTGKTTMVFEPMMARDLEKKFFFKEASKEMGFTALKTGIAHLTKPYSNEFLNENFSLNMLEPTAGKEQIYKAYMKKMIYADVGSSGYVYRDLGFTFLAPDYESTSHVLDVAKNFNIPVNLIDPNNSSSIGLNPFMFEDPALTALAISTVLKGMYSSTHIDVEQAFRENTAAQAVENLSILLKVMYPRLHNGELPTLEDMLDLLNDFDQVEQMCEQLASIPELAEEYRLQIGYFKKTFYKTADRHDTEKFVHSAITQLDNLLRTANVRHILCNRTHNLDFDKALRNGEITLVCTRRGDLGATLHKAFGLFVLLLMQFCVLRRPGNEQSRLPHFLYVDEFPNYLGSATEALFTIYRKYKVGTIISAQNLSQLGLDGKSKYRETILSNCTTKLVFGGLSRDENDIWEREFGDHREWKYGVSYDAKKVEYDTKLSNPKWDWKENIKSGKLQALKFKDCAYKVKDMKGRNVYGDGKVDFLEAKYKEPHSGKFYDFAKFTNGIIDEDVSDTPKKQNFLKRDFELDNNGDTDPIRTDDSGLNLFNNQDAIVFDLNKKD